MGTPIVQRLLRNRNQEHRGLPPTMNQNPLAVSGDGHVNRCSQSSLLHENDLAE
jgi:hypothetical protein